MIYEYFFKVDANPVQISCQCFYSAVMVNSNWTIQDGADKMG